MSQATPADVLRDLDGLRALARSLVHGEADADDLLQDAAVAAITHPPATDRPARPWLATVLRNRWRMDRRASNRRREREHAVTDVEPRTTEGSAEDAIDRARVLERLSAALVALDEPFRSTVIRRYLDGESAADIARAQGVPAGTVRWRLKTGLDRLRAALDDSSPRWKAALAPMVGGAQGAVLVKSKTTLIALILLVLLVGTGALVLVLRGGGDPASSSTVATPSAPTRPAIAPGKAAPASGATAAAVVHDPLPGQGKAALEPIDAPGGAVTGRVINWSTGDGVAGAELTFSAESGASTIRSGDDGVFELAPTAPGAFTLTAVVAPGFLPYAPELLHSSVRVVLAKQQAVRGITVFLFPAVDYQGVVVDGRGEPVAGARVRLLGTPQGEQAIEKLETEWTSGKDGTFVFHAADDAVLEAVHGKGRGFARLDGNVAITKKLTIALGDHPARDATIRGRTVDATGAPLADVLVRAMPSDPPGKEPPLPRSFAFATSGPDGTFVLEDVDRGPYDLAAESDGHAPSVQPGVTGGARDVRLVLDGGKPLGGRVVTTDDVPVPAYTLLVLRKRGIVRELVAARSIVDPRGRFEVRVHDGEHEVIASASGWAPSKPTMIDAGTTDAELVVSPGATLRGVVTAADGAGPLRYARVMREAPGGGASAQPANAGTVTRADGTFELTGIPPGPVSITVAAGGFHPRVEAGMTATDGGELGPLAIQLTKLAEGEQPATELVGIGVKLAPDGDALRVDLVVPGSGAEAAGIVAGDRVVAVDGLPITQLGMEGAVARIRGVVGTKLAVSIAREGRVVQLVVERKKLQL